MLRDSKPLNSECFLHWNPQPSFPHFTDSATDAFWKIQQRLNFHKVWQKFHALEISCVPYISLEKIILNHWRFMSNPICIFYTIRKDIQKTFFSTCEEPFIRFNSVKNKHSEENTERCFCVSIVTLFFLISDATL